LAVTKSRIFNRFQKSKELVFILDAQVAHGCAVRATGLDQAGWSQAAISEAPGVTPGAVSQWLMNDKIKVGYHLQELTAFAKSLKHDLNAVFAALSLPWSNGQVEGQVNRLKLIKRQMYGRAGFDLLRLRVMAR
jgi:hypothetical protein